MPFLGCAIAFLTPMNVQYARQCCSLSAIVVQPEQLETGIIGSAQVALYLVFVAQSLQLTTCLKELFTHRLHTVVAQQIAENLEVLGLVDARVLRYFLEVGEGAPLTLLVGNDGGVVRLRALVVTGKLDTAVIVVVAARRTLVPLVQATGTSLDVVLGTVVPSPSAAYRGATIDFGGVVTLHITHPFIAVADPVTGRFVASRHHQERRVMAVFVDDAPRLFAQVFVNLHAPTQLHAVIGPCGAFRLQVNAHLVGSGKGSLGRTIAVEAHVVQAVLLDLAEYFHP